MVGVLLNSKTESIVAKNLQTQRISFLHKDDYKFVQRPNLNFWKINRRYLDVIRDVELDLNFKRRILFADLNNFQDLHEILDKAKRERADSLLYIT